MKCLRKVTSVFVAVSQVAGVSFAQAQGIGLREAVRKAVVQSPKIQKSESQFREVQAKKMESYGGFLPTLAASASYLLDKKYALIDIAMPAPSSIPQIVPTTNYFLTAQWSLFDGFVSTKRYLSAGAFENSAKSDFDWARFQVEREIVLLYYKAVAAKELKAVAEQNVRALEDHLRDVKLLKKVGSSTNYDVLRIEVQASETKSELLNATDNIELSMGRLSEAMGETEVISEVQDGMPQVSADAINKLGDFKLEDRPDLFAARNKVEALELQEQAASRHWVPRLSLFGQYQYYNNRSDRFNDPNNLRDAFQYGLTLTWNIFDGLGSTARSKQSIEQRFQAEKSYQQATLKAQRDFDFWKRKFLYFCSVYESRRGDIEKAQESVRLSKEGQKVGARTNTDVLDAEAELYRAKAGAVHAQLGAIEAAINIELSTGKKFVEFY